jgi:hypothetical protein
MAHEVHEITNQVKGLCVFEEKKVAKLIKAPMVS